MCVFDTRVLGSHCACLFDRHDCLTVPIVTHLWTSLSLFDVAGLWCYTALLDVWQLDVERQLSVERYFGVERPSGGGPGQPFHAPSGGFVRSLG